MQDGCPVRHGEAEDRRVVGEDTGGASRILRRGQRLAVAPKFSNGLVCVANLEDRVTAGAVAVKARAYDRKELAPLRVMNTKEWAAAALIRTTARAEALLHDAQLSFPPKFRDANHPQLL
eukprot:COSAG05_NODE_3193_length_2252_cov_2.943335_2_plen_120_part_00